MTTINENYTIEGNLKFNNQIDADNNNINSMADATDPTDAVNLGQLNNVNAQRRRAVLIDAQRVTSPQTTLVFDLGANYQDYDYFRLVGSNLSSDDIRGLYTWRGATGTPSSYTVNTVGTGYSYYLYRTGFTSTPSYSNATVANGFHLISRLPQYLNFETMIYNINKVARKFSVSRSISQHGTDAYDQNGVFQLKTGTYQFDSGGSSFDQANNILLFDFTTSSFVPDDIIAGEVLLYGYVSDPSDIDNSSSLNSITSLSGNIGINETNPVERLDVGGDIETYGYLIGPSGTIVRRKAFVSDGSIVSTNSTTLTTLYTNEYIMVKPGNNLECLLTFAVRMTTGSSTNDIYFVAMQLVQYDSNGVAIPGGDSGNVRVTELEWEFRSGGGCRGFSDAMQYVFTTLPNCYRVELRFNARKLSSANATIGFARQTSAITEVTP